MPAEKCPKDWWWRLSPVSAAIRGRNHAKGEHVMTTTDIRAMITVVVGAAIAVAAASAVLVSSEPSAHAAFDVGAPGERFASQPEPHGLPGPGTRVGLGGPDTLPQLRGFNPQPDPPNKPVMELRR